MFRKVSSIAFFSLLTGSLAAATFYVSPTGNDNNAGTIESPFFSVGKAIALAAPGDTIYLRGGTYNYATNVFVISKSGAPGNHIKIWNYPGERPVLDYSARPYTGNTDTNIAFFIRTNAGWWHFKGIEIYRAADSAMKIQGHNNIIEQCVFRQNRDTGLQIGLGDGDTNDGSLAASNQVINCDSYLNYDPQSGGGNADGFACKLSPGRSNVFIGCRAWENSDDGWDLFKSNFRILLEDCWTWHNGDPASFNTNSAGNGNGFKIGGDSSFGAPHIVRRCISFNNRYSGSSLGKGFDQNDNTKGQTLFNCLSFSNNNNYALGNDISESHVVVNCVGFGWFVKNYSFNSLVIHSNNSWNLTNVLTANAADYNDLSETAAKAPRGADGSLPTGFARLLGNSDLIDRGANVGLPYNGTAPDLGPFEYVRTTPQFDTAPANLRMTATGMLMQVKGLTAHGPVVIHASQSLTNWSPIFTNPPVWGTLQFTDPLATNLPARFYRAEEK